MRLDARNHYPQIKHHTPPPKQGNNTPTPPRGATPTPHNRGQGHGPVVSGPNSVFGSTRNKSPYPATSLVVHPPGHPLQIPS